MNKQSVSRRYIRAIIVGTLLNIGILLIWFIMRINPIIVQMRSLKDDIFNHDILLNYSSYNEFMEDIRLTSTKYNVLINVENSSGELVLENQIDRDVSLISKIVNVEEEVYLVDVYFDSQSSISRIVIEALILEALVVMVIFFLTFLYTRQIILKPINLLIRDIRDYQFGKKPKKRELNTEFDLISNEFANLTDLLDEEKREQNRIIASISHDIKTPLTSIIGYSSLLKEQKLNSEAKKYNEIISEKAMDIKELLSTFDDYLFNQEYTLLKLSLIQIKDIVNELNDDYKIELENNNIDFLVTTKIPEKYIRIDIVKMKRVISNMVSNSARYLKNGGKICIDISEDNEYYRFLVRDNGPGVSEKIIDKIFDPLFTTDSSRKISGLGLSICKEFVMMHGGEIEAYNDHGLVILFTISKNIGNKK